MDHKKLRRRFLALLAPLLVLTACATPPTDPAARAQYDANNDPLEPMNRKIFAFDMFLDKWLFKPLAQTYVAVVPSPGRDAIRNFLGNLHEPVIFANDVAQTEFKRAGWTAERFAINSTVGVGGIFDFASRWGVEKQSGDFGQTLYHYGVGEFFYLVLPILGPSNPRDAVGIAVDGYADPFSYLAYDYGADVATYARLGAEGIDQRAQTLQSLDELQRTSIDLYAAIRSLYRQHRASELRHGAPAPSPAEMEGLYNDPDAPAKSGTPVPAPAPAAAPAQH
ncbi:MAG TPA: VacJ family lipoprotein [Stellaceae bacterium]|nr:VacJ family lipoprotein [Stellaceae bacterium]